MSSSEPVWFITGTSHGFGLLLAIHALQAGHRVIGTMRSTNQDAVDKIVGLGGKIVQMDMLESRESIARKVRDAEAIYGRIDFLVNNAGMSLLGILEHFTEEEYKRQFETNVYGPLFAIQACLPGMRARRHGTIVNFSSVGGQDSLATCGAYGASKFALEGLSESLAKEVGEFGVSVLIVEPGLFRTNFLAARTTASMGGATAAAAGGGGGEGEKSHVPDEYRGTAVEKGLEGFAAADGKQPGDPQVAVRKIFDVLMDGEKGDGGGRVAASRGRAVRLPLGMDAFTRIERKTNELLDDLKWAKAMEQRESTAYPSS